MCRERQFNGLDSRPLPTACRGMLRGTGTLPGPRSAQGAALLAFMLALIAGSSWLLLSDLNGHTQVYNRRAGSGLALNQAKQALLSYAMNYPDLRANPEKGPGFLPCPDRNNDGRPETNCAGSTGTTLGRLPFAILGLDDPRDSSGERLWYALSPDFRNTRSNHAVINSETPGQFSVDGRNDVVAVVMAPGPPAAHQYRRPGNDAADYLEGDNASVADGRFSAFAGNDQVAVITRAQLMAVVERRVLNEVRAVLARYRADHSAYPRPAPFADPHADNRVLRGSHTGTNNAGLLTDTRRDFLDWGVGAQDLVRNVTDGSSAVVRTVSRNTLELHGRETGEENDFDRRDIYFIELRGLAVHLTGTAGAGSSGLVLKDTGRDFRELGVVPGDVVDNLDDGSSGTVAAVERTALTLGRLSGGMENDIDFGEDYRLRSNTGTAGPGSAGLTLADPATDFIALGIAGGDLVENLSDGSIGRVGNVAGPTVLTVTGMRFGVNNIFSENDVYRLPRYNAGNNTRKGLLPVHEPGKVFPTGFNVEWRVNVDNRAITGIAPDTHPGYAAAVTRSLMSSADAGAIRVNPEDGYCAWLNARVVECIGISETAPILEGVAASGSSGTELNDAAGDFISAGIKPGDLVDEPYMAVVSRVASSARLNMGQVTAASRSPAPGENYQMRLATRLLNGAAGSSAADRLRDPGRDFGLTGVQPGDVVENVTDGSFGLVTGVNGSTVNATLYGGRDNSFRAGDEYNVYYGYVNRRRYRFNLGYQGEPVTRSSGGARRRDVCLGYGTDCSGAPTSARLPYRGRAAAGTAVSGTPQVLIEDLDDADVVTRTGLTIPPGSASGSIRTTNMDYYLAEGPGELPSWFIKNKWHHLVYIAYGAGFAPGGSGHCTAGTDCLVVQGRTDDAEALVVSAGMALADQDRSTGSITDYFEGENASLAGDDTFVAADITETFNDQVVVVAP